jgi:serine phosphatase RsbU (regulator of sigma subunit)
MTTLFLRIKWFCYFSFLVFFVPSISAQTKSIEWSPSLDGLDISPYLDIYKDPNHQLTPDIAFLKFPKDEFVSNDGKVPNFSATNASYWYRWTIQNTSNINLDLIVKCRYPLLDSVDLYYMDSNKLVHKKSGRKVKESEKEIQFRGSAFSISIPPSTNKEFLIRVNTDSTMSVPLNLYSLHEYNKSTNLDQILQGVYFGVILVMLVFNFFMFVSLKDISYFYYIVYLFFSSFIFQVYFNGYSHIYFFPEYPNWVISSHNFFYLLTIISVFPFFRSLLNLRQLKPKLNIIANFIFSILLLLIPLYPFISYSTMNQIIDIFVVITMIYLTYTTFNLVTQKYTPAYYFLAGFVMVMIGGLITMLKYNGFLPSNYLTENSFQISQGLEVVMMSFALADRIRLMQNQNRLIREKSAQDREKILSFHSEMIIAKELQESTLPLEVPKVEGIKIATRYKPMSFVGGDFYDFHKVNDKTLVILIADVTGHGIPAAFEAAMLKIAFSVEKLSHSNPSNLLTAINRILTNSYKNQYLTASIVLIDLEKMILRIANAGHPSIILHRQSENLIFEFRPKGSLIGFFENLDVHEVEVPIKSKDRILLYTDGLIDGFTDEHKEMYGEDRLIDSLLSHKNQDIEKTADSILNDSVDWIGSSNLTDDLTMIVVDIE